MRGMKGIQGLHDLNPIMSLPKKFISIFTGIGLLIILISSSLWINWKVDCSSLQIGKETKLEQQPPFYDVGNGSPSIPQYIDYNAQYALGELSPMGRKKKRKAMDRVSPKSPSDCGTGLQITKDTQAETLVKQTEDENDHSWMEENEDWAGSSLTRIKAGNQSIVPWQAYIREKGTDTPICGGSLLNPTWILTAQHCEITADNFEIFFGSTAPSAGETGYQVSKIINRNNYRENDHDNDFTLIQLTSPVKSTDLIHSVCLPKPNELYDGLKALASGWGHTKSGKGPFPNKLLSASLTIGSRNGCNGYFRKNNEYDLTPHQICAFTDKNSKLCQGDSGGPLVVKTTQNRYVLVGVVSATYSACGYPIVFGEVANKDINEWIMNNAFS